MSFVTWILLGLIAGFLGSKIVNRQGEGIIIDIILGVLGALMGGYLFRALGQSGISGLNLWSILVATIGAVILLAVYHTIRKIGWARR